MSSGENSWEGDSVIHMPGIFAARGGALSTGILWHRHAFGYAPLLLAIDHRYSWATTQRRKDACASMALEGGVRLAH